MSFTTPVFLLFFLVYVLLSGALGQRGWLWLAAVASSVFYAWWDWRFLFLLYYVVTIAWFIGRRIAASDDPRRRRRYLVFSIVSCLLVLGVFKYFNFFTDSFRALSAALGMPLSSRMARVVLPVGISFYTFHALSYTIDLYRGKLRRPGDYLTVLVYLAYFPQLVAGPIVRAARFVPQIDRGPVFRAHKVSTGLLLIGWGYFLKLCVADSIALLVDPIFAAPDQFQSGNLLFAIVGYSFQIYCDFSGYSLIAIGLAKVQGFDFPANFLAPYFARSLREFWRRWHISLSTFLRDYLYIPLGGSRHGPAREDRNLMITMGLGGLWHGASWNFVIWGLLHGTYLAAERRLGLPLRPVARTRAMTFALGAMRILAVYLLVLLTWVFFRLHGFDDALKFLAGIARLQDLTGISNRFLAAKAVALMGVVVLVDAVFIDRRRVVRLRQTPWAYAGALAILGVLIQLFGTFGGSAFIYFQF